MTFILPAYTYKVVATKLYIDFIYAMSRLGAIEFIFHMEGEE